MKFSIVSRERDRDHQRGESFDATSGLTSGATSSGSNTVTGSGGSGGAVVVIGGSGGIVSSSAGGGGVSGLGGVASAPTFRGFRSHSPTNRRSRERNRREFNRTHGSDQGGLLAYGGISGGLVSDLNSMDCIGTMEESRLSGKLFIFL